MKKTKRIFALVMVVALMLALSMSAFATDTVDLYINGYLEDTFDIGTNTTVYDVVVQYINDNSIAASWSPEYDATPVYSPLCITSNPLYGKYSKKVIYLRSLNGSASTYHTPVAGSIDANNNYIPNQTVDEVLQEADAMLSSYGGLKRWAGNGYGYSDDGTHGVYIGKDWTFTVNGVEPGLHFDPPSPIYGDLFGYTMREALLANGDTIELNYGPSFFVFSVI